MVLTLGLCKAVTKSNIINNKLRAAVSPYSWLKSADLFLCDFQVCLPASVLEHIEPSECVFKLSSSVKTSRGVGKIAMTQRRLFLLTDGRPGYMEVAQYRDLEVR